MSSTANTGAIDHAPVTLLDLRSQHNGEQREALIRAFRQALADGVFVGGKAVDDFESEFASACGVAGCVGVANGTDALVLSLRALGIGSGDRVMVPAFTFIATIEAVLLVGATPVLVDVDSDTCCIDPEALERVCKEPARAVIPVHLYGLLANMNAIDQIAERFNLEIVEDAAQAHGAMRDGQRAGAFGRLGCFSFYPTKNLGALGDAGAVVSNDDELLRRVRSIANHGRDAEAGFGQHLVLGQNSRLDALQAAFLAIKLGRLVDDNRARQERARWYVERLGDMSQLKMPVVPNDESHVFHQFVIRCNDDRRDDLAASLGAASISTAVHYHTPAHLQPAFACLGYGRGDFPIAEQIASECLSLPCHPGLTEGAIDRVCEAVRRFYS